MRSVLLLPLVIVACHNWARTGIPAPAQPLEGNPPQARVVLIDGTEMLLRNPSMSADTLVGDTYSGRGQSIRIAIPTARIKTLEVPKFNVLETAALVVGLSVVAFVSFFILLLTSSET